MSAKLKTLCVTLLILVAAGLAAVGIFWAMIRGQIVKMHLVNSAIEEQTLHRDENIALKNLLADVGPDIESLSSRIIEADATVPFIDSIETLARQSGASVSIDSVDEKPAVEGKDYEYLRLTLSTQGSWNQVHTFISMMESMPYKVTVESITLAQETFEKGGGTASSTRQVSRSWRGTTIISILKKK